MRKLLTGLCALAIALFLSTSAFCQIEKGKWIAGTGFLYGTHDFESTYTRRSQKTKSADIDIYIGKLVSKSLLVGLGVSYSRDLSEDQFADDNYYQSTANNYGFNAYAQNYFQLANALFYNPQFVLEYRIGKSIFRNKAVGLQEISNTADIKAYLVQLNPFQFAYLIKNKIQLQAGFGRIAYLSSKSDSDLQNNNDGVGVGKGFTINFSPNISNIGISVIF
jgi:hypothetical protein